MVIKRRTPATVKSSSDAMRDTWSKRLLQAEPLTIDCSDMDIKPFLQKSIENDMQEVVLRVAQFDSNLDPVAFQAIVRFNDASRQWACAVCPNPYEALAAALMQASKMPAEPIRQRNAQSVGKPAAPRPVQNPAVGRVADSEERDVFRPRPKLRRIAKPVRR